MSIERDYLELCAMWLGIALQYAHAGLFADARRAHLLAMSFLIEAAYYEELSSE